MEKTRELPTILDTVSRIEPLVHSLRDRFDAERELPVELVEALKSARIFTMWVPRKLGGEELDPISLLTVIEALARLDGSLGWCAVISAGYGRLSGALEESAAREIFNGQTVVSGALNPTGRAIRVSGGYRVSGRWTYGSFIGHSAWVVGNCVVHHDDGGHAGAATAPELRLCFFPRDAVNVIDVWHTSGLRATGSNDYEVHELFVPDLHTLEMPAFGPPPRQPGALYFAPMISLFVSCLAVVSLGIARGALDALYEIAHAKRADGSAAGLGEKVIAQVDTARAEALLRAGRALLFDEVTKLWECAQAGTPASLDLRGGVRLAAAHATESAIGAVSLVHRLAGGAALFEGNRLERCFRDINTAGQHLSLVATKNFESVGRTLFGLDPGVPRF